MKNFIIYGAEIISFIILIRVILLYWNKKVFKNQDLESNNKAYALFLSGQIITLSMTYLLSVNEQTIFYLEELDIFGKDANNYWLYFSLLVLAITIIYVISTLIALFFYKVLIPAKEEIHQEIFLNNWVPIIPFSVIQVFSAMIMSSFIAKPLLYEFALSFKAMNTMFY